MSEDRPELAPNLLHRLELNDLVDLLDRSPDPLVIVDIRGAIVFASKQVEAVLGYEPGELIGQPLSRLIPERFHGTHAGHVGHFFTAPRTRPMSPELDLWARTRDGRELSVEISLSSIRAGEEQLVVANLRDVTSRRRAMTEVVNLNRELFQRTSELEALVSDLRVFAQTASHDLQAPLRQITQFLLLLKRRSGGSLTPEGAEYIECAIESATRLSNMVANVLAYSRIGASAITFDSVNLDKKLTCVLDALRLQLEESAAVVTRDPLPVVYADASQIAQLLQNLITNAIRYRADSPPRIHVSAVRDGERWTISVRDNGAGIDPAHHKRIFEMFQRVGSNSDASGAGVGLAICKRVVDRHHGRMWVTSELGKGATFWFTLAAEPEPPLAALAA